MDEVWCHLCNKNVSTVEDLENGGLLCANCLSDDLTIYDSEDDEDEHEDRLMIAGMLLDDSF